MDLDLVADAEEIELRESDVIVKREGRVPKVNISQNLESLLPKQWDKAVVVRVLGTRVGYKALCNCIQALWNPNGMKVLELGNEFFLVRFNDVLDFHKAILDGPWTVFGNYLMVKPWTTEFDITQTEVGMAMVWIRLPVLRAIGEVIGKVVKIDYNTKDLLRGRFVRLAVSVDLRLPLLSKFMLNGKEQLIEYESLPDICYECGRYGHRTAICPHKQSGNRGFHKEGGAVGKSGSRFDISAEVQESEGRGGEKNDSGRLHVLRPVQKRDGNDSVEVLENHKQYIHFSVFEMNRKIMVITAVYAHPVASKRACLWQELERLRAYTLEPWFIASDFNAILRMSERKGCARNRAGVYRVFQDWFENFGLLNLGFKGIRFTWKRGNLQERLDRALCNVVWRQEFPEVMVKHLARYQSDHCPLLVQLNSGAVGERQFKPFHFQVGWISHEGFVKFVWNKTIFGNIFVRKRKLLNRLEGIQRAMERRCTASLLEIEQKVKKELEMVLWQEEVLWFQKSHKEWIQGGDRNTAYFHMKTVCRRRRNRVEMLKNGDGVWVED
ncbi:hypothetical protein P3X46_006327 [Hevea brasiliensis]|uniref:CCHC-type domain-containing protein n=1 Tax=Hevea brasiliensis TaxID=3981 RepID=A0ABQ9MSF2_HEVBR|nr:hypothetical protein P3X46_006327 [Hevea brasiliensis]